MEARGHDDSRVRIEVNHSQAIRIAVEFEMEVTQHPGKSTLETLQTNVRIGVEEHFTRAEGNLFTGVYPFFCANIGQTEMEPNRAFKPPSRIAGMSQFSGSEIPSSRRWKPQISPLVSASSTIVLLPGRWCQPPYKCEAASALYI